jgi:hypothetical protein
LIALKHTGSIAEKMITSTIRPSTAGSDPMSLPRTRSK